MVYLVVARSQRVWARLEYQGVTDDWYNGGLLINETGKAMSALSELKNFLSTTGISNIKIQDTKDESWYTLQGTKITKPTQPGIYIHDGKKIVNN